jgi:hypothetical protein
MKPLTNLLHRSKPIVVNVVETIELFEVIPRDGVVRTIVRVFFLTFKLFEG